MIYEDSYVGQTSGIALNGVSNIPDKQVALLCYNLQMNSPALAGFISLNIKWHDRNGVLQTENIGTIALLGSNRMKNAVPLYFRDTGNGNGNSFQWELVTTGVLGSFNYDFAVGLEHLFYGN